MRLPPLRPFCPPRSITTRSSSASTIPTIQRSRTFQWKSELRHHIRRGALSEALLLYRDTWRHGVIRDASAFSFLLKISARLPCLRLGSAVHGGVLKTGFEDDVVVATGLVDMFSKCCDVDSARKVFDEMPVRDTVAWNAMLAGYSRNGYANEALALFAGMGFVGLAPNSLTLSVLLQVCSGVADDRLGACVHGYVQRVMGIGVGDDYDVFLCNSLLVFYNECGKIGVAQKVFERMPKRDLVSWNVMISGYTLNGCAGEALEMFHRLREEGFDPDLVTLETALQACAFAGDAIKDGRLIHKLLVLSEFSLNIYVENSLLRMYCKCGDVDSAQFLFDKMPVRNLVSWNILVQGYNHSRQPQKALALFKCMHTVKIEVSSDLLVSSLLAVKLLGGCLKQIICIHSLVIKSGFNSDGFVNNSLISVYGESGHLRLARRCFDYLIFRRDDNKVIWNTMLSAYTHNGCFDEATELVRTMQFQNCKFDSITLVNVLLVCMHRLDLKQGKVVHGYIIRNQLETNVFVMSALLELYVKCGLLGIACLLFSKMPQRNVVTWNNMILGCCENGFPRVSLNLFHLMQQLDGLRPDATTMVGVVKAISQRGFEREGKYIHDYVIQLGFGEDEYVINSLIAMFAGLGDYDKMIWTFSRVNKPSMITWNTMIAEFAHHGLSEKAIAVFHLMKLKNYVAPNSVTLLSLLPACAHSASLPCGMWAHAIVSKTGYESDVFVGTAMIDVYAKCGDINTGWLFFERMNYKTTVSWNSMIWGYGMHGNVEKAHKLFSQMQRLGCDPDIITFLILISACSHSGDVENGRWYFDLMIGPLYTMSPRLEHYSSVVDLLGRGGLLREAFEFVNKMPVAPGTCTWGALLGACRVHGNMEVGLIAAEKLFELDPSHCGYHVLLSNMYAESGKWFDAAMIRWKLGKMRVEKLPGTSMVENFI